LDFTIRSIEKLFDTYDIKAVKIGFASLYYLNVLITEIKSFRQQQKNSLGYRFKIFHHLIFFWPSVRNIKSILIQIDLITPNYTEIAQLSNETIPERIAENLSEYCTVLLKGGHNPNEQESITYM
jgi:hydroxymethylpyrimidine/phosphomethylpyrimidine kinase